MVAYIVYKNITHIHHKHAAYTQNYATLSCYRNPSNVYLQSWCYGDET